MSCSAIFFWGGWSPHLERALLGRADRGARPGARRSPARASRSGETARRRPSAGAGSGCHTSSINAAAASTSSSSKRSPCFSVPADEPSPAGVPVERESTSLLEALIRLDRAAPSADRAVGPTLPRLDRAVGAAQEEHRLLQGGLADLARDEVAGADRAAAARGGFGIVELAAQELHQARLGADEVAHALELARAFAGHVRDPLGVGLPRVRRPNVAGRPRGTRRRRPRGLSDTARRGRGSGSARLRAGSPRCRRAPRPPRAPRAGSPRAGTRR